METFAEKIIAFNKQLNYSGNLPNNFQVLNPYLSNPETLLVMQQFYEKFYNDTNKRKFIIGINPSRHGAGVTGVPFTDTKRLESVCGIKMQSARTHEDSSVLLYVFIERYGGTESFYKKFFINYPFPLAIVRQAKNGQWLNANYYDDRELLNRVKDFMIESLQKFIAMGLDSEGVFILGKKNAEFIKKLNYEANLFGKLTALEHPRFIQQYKSK